MGTVLLSVLVAFFGLMVVMQVVMRLRARAQTGKPVPALPGALGKHIAKGRRALVYFFSPGCAACRTITPQVRDLSRCNADVHLIDVSQDLETARALSVMATPSFVEIEGGTISSYRIGPAPDLVQRYAS
jgi:thiol-disulfide isomerase/thioredoxin